MKQEVFMPNWYKEHKNMIKVEYLITLLELFTHRTSRVWEELFQFDFSSCTDSEFYEYARKMIKDKRTKERFQDKNIQKAITRTSEIINFCLNNRVPISIISFEHEDYPKEKFLAMAPNERPIILYGIGNMELLKMDSVAIIGSRETDKDYFNRGIEISKNLAGKYVIVSGLAIGSDTAAHEGALLANGKTIAILANGLNTIYPKENTELANLIIQKDGLLLSEYPPFSATKPYYFAKRDRLQAILSKAVIVIESGVKSGTMITVNHAKSYGKRILVLDTFKNDNIYNDKGNTILLASDNILKISIEYSSLAELVNMIEISKNKTIKIKIIHTPNFKKYLIDGKEYTRIPKNYKEITRAENEIIAEVIEE
jgi:DNA processing protein